MASIDIAQVRAAHAVLEHVDYYAALKTGENLVGIRKIAKQAALKPAPKIMVSAEVRRLNAAVRQYVSDRCKGRCENPDCHRPVPFITADYSLFGASKPWVS